MDNKSSSVKQDNNGQEDLYKDNELIRSIRESNIELQESYQKYLEASDKVRTVFREIYGDNPPPLMCMGKTYNMRPSKF